MKVKNSTKCKSSWKEIKAPLRKKSKPGEMKKTKIFIRLKSHKRHKK